MGPPMKLIDSDEEPEAEDFTINKSYAERYDIWRNKEELQKLKDLSKDISSSSSESEEEQEPLIEKDFLKTLSLLKSKDPRIYDEKTEFFKDEVVTKKPKAKKEKPMFMKDYEREIILEQNGKFVDEDDDEEQLPKRALLSNKEEQELKQSFQEAAPNSDEEDNLFQVRTKTKVEEEKEEADYKQWLKTENDMGFLNNYWNNPDIGEDEKFLRDYILNKRYAVDDKTDEIPTYDGITQDIDLLNEDEQDLQKQEMFEHKYNFRFEEPDEEFIKSYPRTIGDSLRRENNKRKQKREEYTERKKKEKEQKREELKRLKALKRKEIEEKFLKLKEASGQDQLNLDESDIESDFDPDKHDKKMREMFNDDYYDVSEEQKPEFEYDEEIDDENWDHWTRDQSNYSQNRNQGKTYEESSSEEENSKVDSRSQFEQEMIDSTTSNKKRKGKKKSVFAQILSESKPLFDPSGKSFDEYLNEYYKLDYEDIVGDMPVRFKYRKVVPNDFGLTVDEILAAQDKELNRWCSVKKTCQYRDDKDEMYDVQAFQKKAQNFESKKKILTSVYPPPEEKTPQANEDNSNETTAKSKRKKKRSKKKKATDNPDVMEEIINSVQNDGLLTDNTDPNMSTESAPKVREDSKLKKRKKRKSFNNTPEENSKSHLHKSENGTAEEVMPQSNFHEELSLKDADTETNQNMVVKGSKKKKKKSKSMVEGVSFLNSESYIQTNEMNVEKGSTKKKRKKSRTVKENDSTVDSHGEIQLSENVISKKKEQMVESLENESPSSYAENEEDNDHDEAQTKHVQNVVKKRKLNLVDEINSSSTEQPNNSMSKKSKSANNERIDYSSVNSRNPKSSTKSIYAESTAESDSFYSNHKKKMKFKTNRQSFDSWPSQKQNFQSRKFHSNKKQNDNNSIQIVDSSGKKIVSSNSRLSAFEINPKKFKNKLIYGKTKHKKIQSF